MFVQHETVLKLAATVVMAAIALLNARQVQAQGGLVVENAAVSVDFGRTITFSARIKTPIPIKQASILLRGVNEEVIRVETLKVAQDGSVDFTYDTSHNALPPFGTVVFWFQATLEDDNTYTSAPITFVYDDNRFPWHVINRARLNLHWYAGDDSFGAAALDAAGSSLLAIRDIFPLPLTDPIDIYIYSNPQDMQNASSLGGKDWAAGHTDPGIGVVLVAIEPGPNQALEMNTKIPHELAHLILFRALGDGYARQPVWLLEGIASMAELHPNPDYALALQTAARNGSLLSLKDLCASFPVDAGNAFLAYAQSQSFVAYIRNTYGNSSLTRLTGSYTDGFSCDLGATNALGIPLSQLDTRWRVTVPGQNVLGAAARSLTPFILLMALVVIVPLWGAIDMVRERRKRGQQPK